MTQNRALLNAESGTRKAAKGLFPQTEGWMRSAVRCLLDLRVLVIVLAAVVLAAAPARAVLGPALVFDADTGEVLIEEHAGEPWYPASLTKLMTAYLVFDALEAGELRLDQMIPVSEAAAKLPPSKIGIPAGNSIKVELALQALLIHSANDMAVVLAEAVSGSVVDFVDEMNATARALKMTGTHFANPHGLPDPGQVTTARDMGLLAGVIHSRFPLSQAYFAAPEFVIGGVTLRNRNGLLRQMPEADGMKTGFICDSGFNLVASATLEGHRLISVVMGAKSAPSRNVLTQVLLESAAVLARSTKERPTLLAIDTRSPGSAHPKSLGQMMCHGAPKVKLTAADELTSWGVSLGRYPAPLTAEAVLTGRLLADGAVATDTPRGVLHDASTDDYIALVWDMSMRETMNLCARVKRLEAPCEVMSPAAFAEMAKPKGMAGDPPVPIPTAAPRSEGSQ
jgi:D-alanyl-D-alanine carboxypeptidase